MGSKEKVKLYLASASVARRNILSGLGFVFKTLPVDVPERGVNGRRTKSFPALVKRNALAKALAGAGMIAEGVVIAADTVSEQGGKIYGKPRDLREAASMLKKLSGGSQRVYTGISVVRKDRRGTLRIKTACERTKVYMDKLDSKEIRSYLSCGAALGKAGSFDIQGKGALFIKGINGCFYNVVGLPVRLLYRMLKDSGVNLFSYAENPRFLSLGMNALDERERVAAQREGLLRKNSAQAAEKPRALARGASFLCVFFLCVCAGCSTEYNSATERTEAYYYSTEREVRAGEAIARAVEKEYRLADDPLLQERARRIGSRVAAVCGRREIKYTFKVLDDEEINAVSLPGGFVYVNKGVLEKASGDDEVAGVLAHEVGHIVSRHSIKKMQGMTGYSLLRILLVQAPDPGKVGSAADAAFVELMLGYSREDELQADKLAARYMKAAGYDPKAMISFLEKLWDDEKRKPPRRRSYFKTHPYIPDRIRVVKQELGDKMGFTDYINIEQLPADAD